MTFHPADRPVPETLRTDDVVLVPLTTAHVALDYDALMDSREILRMWSGTTWPADDFTLDANREDLARHDREHQNREAFTYTVLDPEQSECLGCVYITPLSHITEDDPQRIGVAPETAVVGFWVRRSRLADGLEARLLAALRNWFSTTWAFEHVSYVAREQDGRQVAILTEAGLEHHATLTVARRAGSFRLYRQA